MHTVIDLYQKALSSEFLTAEEGLLLYECAPTSDLIFIGNELRKKLVPENTVTWMIDRNVNITNVCCSHCTFCNFYRNSNSAETYITSIAEYKQKVDELYLLGGDQLLLQGGLHPKLKLDFYINLFKELKQLYPSLKLHALGPPEIVHIAKLENINIQETLKALVNAGLDSLPGAGAEILNNKIRKQLSPGKCNTEQWLDVMREAHKLNLPTSATMMFGHIETKMERIEHLMHIRQVQSEKPTDAYGFVAFIPWPFQDKGTKLCTTLGNHNVITADEYVRTIAISRIMLPNVTNIQASWLTVGKQTAQLCLHAGANDMGSIMIEENVVSAAGATNNMDEKTIKQAIIDAGFDPKRRNQKYEEMEEKS